VHLVWNALPDPDDAMKDLAAERRRRLWLDFADDFSVQFGEKEEFYVQWRQRFSPEFLSTKFVGGEGWKQVIIGEGSRAGALPDRSMGRDYRGIATLDPVGYGSTVDRDMEEHADELEIARGWQGRSRARSSVQTDRPARNQATSRHRIEAGVGGSAHREKAGAASRGDDSTGIDRRETGPPAHPC
jgi:hypothetical protein